VAASHRPCLGRAVVELTTLEPDHEATCRRWWSQWRERTGHRMEAAAFRRTFGTVLGLFRGGEPAGTGALLRQVGVELLGGAVSFPLLSAASRTLRDLLREDLGACSLPEPARQSYPAAIDDLADGVLCALSMSTLSDGAALEESELPVSCVRCPLAPPVGGAGPHLLLPEPARHPGGLVGASLAMQELYGRIAMMARGPGSVLVTGESGAGKELVARAIHEVSGDGAGPFVVLNCAALPRELIEGELFGHAAGAFTGSRGTYAGLVRAAHQGTLLLDEITEMPVELQAKLLRVIETRLVRPLGSTAEVPIRVRFLASTNRDPQVAMQEGRLRPDLYFRLATYALAVPPLRERPGDLLELLAHFAAQLAEAGLRRVTYVEERLVAHLSGYAFPGNVRELRALVEYALASGEGPNLELAHLPPVAAPPAAPRAPLATALAAAPPAAPTLPSVEEAELQLIRQALVTTGGNKLRAASLLGISRHRLYSRLAKLRER
jgi:transcriptional regulator with AAA-type ATPase domain